MSKQAYYFSHDSNARNDVKILRLRRTHGNKGYGAYWAIIELCCNESHSVITNYNDIGNLIGCCPKLVESVLNDFGLFTITDQLAEPNQTGFTWVYGIKHLLPGRRVRLINVNYRAWYRLREKVFYRDNFTCSYCGSRGGRLELDHIVPFSKGGGDTIENLTTACMNCNRSKRDKNVDEFKRELLCRN